MIDVMGVYILTRVEDGHQWLIQINDDGTGSIAERPLELTGTGSWSAPTYVMAERVAEHPGGAAVEVVGDLEQHPGRERPARRAARQRPPRSATATATGEAEAQRAVAEWIEKSRVPAVRRDTRAGELLTQSAAVSDG